jgi:hypothetical protein
MGAANAFFRIMQHPIYSFIIYHRDAADQNKLSATGATFAAFHAVGLISPV